MGIWKLATKFLMFSKLSLNIKGKTVDKTSTI
nr:MAG TPA: hypothetical protein [Caudoviricetes sp.]